MAAVLIQTKDVIDRLKACGLKRSEFSARCERLMNGSTFCGYGDVRIILWCSMERQRELAPKIAEHFRVVQNILDGRPSTVYVYEKGTPGLTIEEY